MKKILAGMLALAMLITSTPVAQAGMVATTSTVVASAASPVPTELAAVLIAIDGLLANFPLLRQINRILSIPQIFQSVGNAYPLSGPFIRLFLTAVLYDAIYGNGGSSLSLGDITD